VEVPKVRAQRYDDQHQQTVWGELPATEILPHRPDAFFTLYLPGNPAEQQRLNFFYEADRGTENTPHFKKSSALTGTLFSSSSDTSTLPTLCRGLKRCSPETLTDRWADKLQIAAKENIVSGSKPSPLFWFTSSEQLTAKPAAGQSKSGKRRLLEISSFTLVLSLKPHNLTVRVCLLCYLQKSVFLTFQNH
jgi:hypothetical protein